MYWEVETLDEEDLAAAVTAVQYFEATWEWLRNQPYPRGPEQLAVMEWFTGPEQADFQLGLLTDEYYASKDSVSLIGPRWIRLLAVGYKNPDEVLVVMCYDKGWFTEDGLAGEARAAGRRADLHAYQVVRDPGLRGGERWRVWDWEPNSAEGSPLVPLGTSVSELDASCEQWAVHEPDDIPE